MDKITYHPLGASRGNETPFNDKFTVRAAPKKCKMTVNRNFWSLKKTLLIARRIIHLVNIFIEIEMKLKIVVAVVASFMSFAALACTATNETGGSCSIDSCPDGSHPQCQNSSGGSTPVCECAHN